MADEEHSEGGGVVRQLLAIFGFKVDEKELKEGEVALEGFLETAKGIAEAVAAVFAVDAIYEWAVRQVEAMDAIEHASQKLGLSTDRIQELSYAADQADISTEAFLDSLGKLQVNQAKAAEGTKASAEAFEKLHVSVKDASGRLKGADDLFADVANAIAEIKDPAKAAESAVALFGKQGRNLLPLLKRGAEGIKEFKKEFAALGGGYGKEAIEAGGKLDEQIKRNRLSWKSLSGVIFTQLEPALEAVLSIGGAIINWFREMIKNSQFVTATLLALGTAATAFAIRMAIAAAPILAVAAALFLIVSIVDDLLVLFSGGESVIGDGIDAIFGKGASTATVKLLRDLWHEIADLISKAWRDLKGFGAELSDEAEAITGYLGLTRTKEQRELDEKREKDEKERNKDDYRYLGKDGDIHTVKREVQHGESYEDTPHDSVREVNYKPPGPKGEGGRSAREAGGAVNVDSPITINVIPDSALAAEQAVKHARDVFASEFKRKLAEGKRRHQRIDPNVNR